MYRVIDLLEQALRTHECIVLPGIGAFLREFVYARYDEQQNMLYPASEQIHFNESLNTRDGLLDQEYAKLFAISMRRARLMVDEDIALLRKDLFRLGCLSFGSLGVLEVTEDGSFLFSPSAREQGKLTAYSYGLYPQMFLISPSKKDQSSDPTRAPLTKTDELFFHFRVRKSVARWSAAAAIFLLCLIPVTTDPVGDRYSAGFFTGSNVFFNSETHQEYLKQDDTTPKENKDAETPTVTIEKQQAIPLSESATIVSQSYKELAKGYYIVIGAFKTEGKAISYSQQIREKDNTLPQPRIINKGGNYLILHSEHHSAQDAYKQLNSKLLHHTIKELRSAWILAVE